MLMDSPHEHSPDCDRWHNSQVWVNITAAVPPPLKNGLEDTYLFSVSPVWKYLFSHDFLQRINFQHLSQQDWHLSNFPGDRELLSGFLFSLFGSLVGCLVERRHLIIIYWVSRWFPQTGFQAEGWAGVDAVNYEFPSNINSWTSFIDCYCHLFLFLFSSMWFKNLYVNSREIYHGLRCIWNKLSIKSVGEETCLHSLFEYRWKDLKLVAPGHLEAWILLYFPAFQIWLPGGGPCSQIGPGDEWWSRPSRVGQRAVKGWMGTEWGSKIASSGRPTGVLTNKLVFN